MNKSPTQMYVYRYIHSAHAPKGLFSPICLFYMSTLVWSLLVSSVIRSPVAQRRSQLWSETLALKIPLVTCHESLSTFRWDNRAHRAAFLLPATKFLISTERDKENTFLPLFRSLSCCKLLCVWYQGAKESKLCLFFCLSNKFTGWRRMRKKYLN